MAVTAIAFDGHGAWPAAGDVLEVVSAEDGRLRRTYYLLLKEEPIQQLRVEWEVPPGEFVDREVRELEVVTTQEKVLYYGRIGVIRGNVLLLNPQLAERWGLDKYKDPERGIEEGVLAGFVDPITSPAWDPSPTTGFWVIGNNVWPVLRGWNPSSKPRKVACVIHPLKFTATEVTREKYPALLKALESKLIKARTIYLFMR